MLVIRNVYPNNWNIPNCYGSWVYRDCGGDLIEGSGSVVGHVSTNIVR